MRPTNRFILLLAALPLAAAALLWAAAGSPANAGEPERTRDVKLILAGGADDQLRIDDLDTLEVGESRTYVTDSGKNVIAIRDADGVELDVDGKKIRVGADLKKIHEDAGQRFVMKRMVVAEDGGNRIEIGRDGGEVAGDHDLRWIESGEKGTHRVVISNGDGAGEVVFLGADKGDAYAFSTGGRALLLGPDALLERLEKNQKFLSLDDETREIVRQAIRESSPRWIGESDGGHGLRIEIRDHGDDAP